MTAGGHLLLDPAAYIHVPWKNGGGVSVTIAGERLPGAAPGDWSGVLWQLGRTSIVTPAPFSDLSGFERLQTVIGGRGLYLDTPEGALDLSEPLTIARYDGGTPIVSRLTAGPVDVVNLIARRDRLRADMVVLRQGQSVLLGDGMHVIHACSGAVVLSVDAASVTLVDDAAVQIISPCSVSVTSGLAIIATVEPL